MTSSEALMIGIMVGLSAGVALGAILVRRTMVPETKVMALQQSLWHAMGAVRTAMMNLGFADHQSALESAERHLADAGNLLGTKLKDEGDR